MKSDQINDGKSGEEKKKLTCGIIMPIAPHPDYPNGHWTDVLDILKSTIDETDFDVCLVWDDPATGLIHERIVNNIYNTDIVICDVSSKNPNVMFELGLRLAFDKPTIIIKDELTGYSFDTGVIDHIPYPSSLRFSEINLFKQKLRDRIQATYAKSKSDSKYSPFLKQFGTKIVPATIVQTEIPENKYILKMLEEMRLQISKISVQRKSSSADIEETIDILTQFLRREYAYSGKYLIDSDIDRIILKVHEKTGVMLSTNYAKDKAISMNIYEKKEPVPLNINFSGKKRSS